MSDTLFSSFSAELEKLGYGPPGAPMAPPPGMVPVMHPIQPGGQKRSGLHKALLAAAAVGGAGYAAHKAGLTPKSISGLMDGKGKPKTLQAKMEREFKAKDKGRSKRFEQAVQMRRDRNTLNSAARALGKTAPNNHGVGAASSLKAYEGTVSKRLKDQGSGMKSVKTKKDPASTNP